MAEVITGSRKIAEIVGLSPTKTLRLLRAGRLPGALIALGYRDQLVWTTSKSLISQWILAHRPRRDAGAE
jgi:hypothetical protein